MYLYGPLVYEWCRRMGLQDADASDVGQDVFRAVFGAIGRFERNSGQGSFRKWLKSVTNNKVRDFARSKRRGAEGVGGSDALARLLEIAADPASDPNDADAPSDEVLLLRRAVELVLADLSEETRQAFWQVVAEGRDPADVARELGLSVNAVYLVKSRVKRRIREEFDGLVEG